MRGFVIEFIFHEALIMQGNRHNLLAEVKCRYDVDFSKPNNIGSLLRIEGVIVPSFTLQTSNRPVNILKVQVYRICCNLIWNSYEGEQKSHVIHKFFPSVPPGYKINQVPKQLIYSPLNSRVIHDLEIRLSDQDGKLLDFRGEPIHLRLHIRPNADNIQ